MPHSSLTIQSQNRLNTGEIITQEVPSTKQHFRRWVAIYPLTSSRVKEKYPGFKFKVIDFEVAIDLIDTYLDDEKLFNKHEFFAINYIELEKLLSQLQLQAEKFDAPWKNDYPL